jgi:hypothetical protein
MPKIDVSNLPPVHFLVEFSRIYRMQYEKEAELGRCCISKNVLEDIAGLTGYRRLRIGNY